MFHDDSDFLLIQPKSHEQKKKRATKAFVFSHVESQKKGKTFFLTDKRREL